MYKKTARILPLAFVDDLNGISKCGNESLALNVFLTTQIELKKLKFHVPDKSGKTKCHKMHIGILNILENVSFGPDYFQMAMLFRESMLINGIMTKSEIWYNLSKTEIDEFSKL